MCESNSLMAALTHIVPLLGYACRLLPGWSGNSKMTLQTQQMIETVPVSWMIFTGLLSASVIDSSQAWQSLGDARF